ncbi:MAG: CopG family transcriptional regulator [Gammaproteobacteria bacterium]|nr:CopG family transcriptional regulator [Gammaproteobacteria bacterium]MYG95978.1 CopG family transcriptional regulator [Gammaproteobacteria bacterium]
MAGKRASLSISTPNDSWIQAQIASGEFASRSEVVNDLIRRAREIDLIRARLIAAEQSGPSARTPEQILAASKEELRGDGEL